MQLNIFNSFIENNLFYLSNFPLHLKMISGDKRQPLQLYGSDSLRHKRPLFFFQIFLSFSGVSRSTSVSLSGGSESHSYQVVTFLHGDLEERQWLQLDDSDLKGRSWSVYPKSSTVLVFQIHGDRVVSDELVWCVGFFLSRFLDDEEIGLPDRGIDVPISNR